MARFIEGMYTCVARRISCGIFELWGLKRDSRFAPVVGVELATLFQDRYVTRIPVVTGETRRPRCSTRPGVRLHQGSTVLVV